jgi:hypothetical protein
MRIKKRTSIFTSVKPSMEDNKFGLAYLALSNFLERLLEPSLSDIKGLSSLDTLEFNGTDGATFLVLVLSHASGNTGNGRGNTLLGAVTNEGAVEFVGGGSSGKVSRLLDNGLFGTNQFSQVLAEVGTRIDLGQGHMTESVTGDLLAARLHVSDNFLNTSSLSEKDIDTAVFVHDLLETGTFSHKVQFDLRDPDGVDVTGRLARGKGAIGKLLLRQRLAVVVSSFGSQESRITSHALVKDQHAWVGGGFIDHIGEEKGALLGSSIGTKSLVNGVDIVINGLGHTNDSNLSSVLLQNVLGKSGSLNVGVVSSNGVEDTDLVGDQSQGGDFQRSLVLLAVSTLDAIGSVGQLESKEETSAHVSDKNADFLAR